MRNFAIAICWAALTTAACEKSAPPGSAAMSATGQEESAPVAAPEPATSAAAAAAETGTWREMTVPAGTTIAVLLDTPVGSDSSRVEQLVEAHVSKPVLVDGATAIPEDSLVAGVVTQATPAGKVKGRAHIALRFESIIPRGQNQRYDFASSAIARTAPSEKKQDAAKIAVPAAGGAVIGGIVGGKKGAVIGGAVGGGAGTAVVLFDSGQEVRLGKGASISLRLTAPLTVRVRG